MIQFIIGTPVNQTVKNTPPVLLRLFFLSPEFHAFCDEHAWYYIDTAVVVLIQYITRIHWKKGVSSYTYAAAVLILLQ